MDIEVEHVDTFGNRNDRIVPISRLAFVKHLAIAGQGYAPKSQKIFRTLGAMLHYSNYIQRHAFNDNHFSLPPRILSDPTEQAHFSNLAGKAIADFLSKKLDNSMFTVNYEAVASRPLRGKRPDLVAFSPSSVFTLEAKGRNQNNPGDMIIHKAQAAAGNYERNFSIACVSYNLFNKVKCNYHDPLNENILYDEEGLRRASRKFYTGFLGLLDQKFFQYRERTFANERFYEIELVSRSFEKLFPDEFRFHPFWLDEILHFRRPRIIIPQNIRDLAENGLTRQVKPFAQIDDDGLYIDSDRIGLQIR